jgi:hypothetical protein
MHPMQSLSLLEPRVAHVDVASWRVNVLGA